MKCELRINGVAYTISTEHSAASYNRPVILAGGEIVGECDAYQPDEPELPTVLNLLADAHRVFGGAATRRALADYAGAHLPEEPIGADYDRVIGEFVAIGRREAERELAE